MLKLREERQKQKMTLTELSRRTHIPVPVLSNLEQGKVHPWPKYRLKISEVLNIEADVLFDEARPAKEVQQND